MVIIKIGIDMINIIVAPRSEDKSAEGIAKKVVKYLKTAKVEFSTYFSSNLEDVKTIAGEVESLGETNFVIVGDDIVLSVFLNALKSIEKVTLGMIPTANENDFATYLNISENPITAIKDILKNNAIATDLLIANNMRVLNNIVIGSSAEENKKFSGVTLFLDAKKAKQKKVTIFDLVVANAGLNKMKNLSPLANVDDGLFNLTYLPLKSEKENLSAFKSFKSGNQIYLNDIHQFWLDNLKITGDRKKFVALIDKQPIEFETLNISILEKGIKIHRHTN